MPITYPVSYTTVENVQILITRISSTNITSADQAYMIGRAEAFINGRIGQVYDLPITGVNVPVLQEIAEELGAYFIIRRFFVDQAKSMSEWVEEFKTNALDSLAAVMSKTIILATDSGDMVSMRSDAIYSDTKDYHPTMDHRDEILQHIDSDLLEAEDDLANE